jgi:2-octaprenyl-3-methyl-6-methoxy-1,4-benzoquinol hydroxylase
MDMFDCIVVGGGMVGAASALVLAELGLTVAIVEQKNPDDFSSDQPFDLRISAISLASEHLLAQLGAWPRIEAGRNCPYSRLGVWEEALAYTEFNAESINQSYLGHIIENRMIQLALWEELSSNKNIRLFCPDKLVSFHQSSESITVTLSSTQLSAKLLIGADGANSQVRTLANIGLTGWDYQQSAMLINVETAHPQENITWQQFYPSGPVAMLPLAGESDLGGYASLVWYHHKDEIKRLSLLTNKALQEEILQHFPKRLGDIKVIDKAAFPLTRRHANQYQKNRVLLLGDAAHTINPMAGQGVNLGFKDVKALQKIIATAISEGKCWHDPDVLAGYEKARRKDNLLMMSMMDLLTQAFSHPSPVAKIVRNAGLFLANNVSTLKKKALAYACGV